MLRRKQGYLLTLAGLHLIHLSCGALAQTAEESTVLPEIVVEAPALDTSLTSRSVDEARDELARVPGGTSLIEAEDFRAGPTSNLQDIFEFTPGVFAQNRFGGDEVRISIRGSGISQDFAVKGLRYLRNGIPASEADGDFHSQLLEPLTAEYIEVYRGANALEYGASTLGGAINFVTYTGYTADPLSVYLAAGSDGFLRPQISSGSVLDNGLDYYASLSGSYADGFREHAETESTRFYGNLGYRFNDQVETRLHVDAQDSNQELPGGITLGALKDDPRQSSAFFEGFNSQNNFDRYRVELQNVIRFREQDNLNVGLYYETQAIDHPLPFGVFDEDQDNYGVSLRHEMHGNLAGRENRFIWGGILALEDIDLNEFTPIFGGGRGPLRAIQASDILTGELFFENQWQYTDKLTLVAGTQFGYAERQTDFTDPATRDTTRLDEGYAGFSPKLGLIWQLHDSAQLFGNISRSYEPPIILEFNNAFDPFTGIVTPELALDDQEATTIEIGTRGSSKLLTWDVALYHSRITDELLTVEVNLPGSQFATSNADKTTHSGIEAGFQARYPVNLMGNDELRLRAVFTYNRFRFNDDGAFGDNDIPGIPDYFGNLELLYRHPSGFYAGPTLQYASEYYIDFANTFKADAYTIFGLRAGYDDPAGRFKLFLEGRNLEDEPYVSNTSTVANANGTDQSVFNPGQGRAVFVGIEWKLQ